MQRKHTDNSTSNIYKILKDFNPSIKLSNLRHFPNNIINNTSFLFKIFCLLSLASLEKTEAAISYFSSPDKKQNYKSIITGNSNIDIGAGNCGTIEANQAVADSYQVLKNWLNPTNQDQLYNIQILQGRNEPANNTLQECIFNFIQEQIDVIQAPIEVEKAAKAAANKDNGIIILSTIGAVLGFFIFLAIVAAIVYKIQNRLDRHHLPTERITRRNDETDSEEDEETIYDSDPRPNLPTVIEIEKEKKATMVERLEKLTNIKNINIPERFICPVNKTIMTDPCITNDGFVYEREVLERLQKERQRCPINPDEFVINITPNNPLRSDIMSFVEEQERMEKEKNVSIKSDTEDTKKLHINV